MTPTGIATWRRTAVSAALALAACLLPMPSSAQPIAPGPAALHTETAFDLHSYSSDPVAFDGRLYFSSRDKDHGWEVWRSNGTADQAALFVDIQTGPASSHPYGFVRVGRTLYFFVYQGDYRSDLWKTDGTARGTMRVKSDVEAASGWYPVKGVPLDGTLLFTSETGRLWRSDGTRAGTFPIAAGLVDYYGNDQPWVPELVRVGDRVFMAKRGAEGTELWVSNGTKAGTRLVKDINPGGLDGGPVNLTKVGRTLFFTIEDATHGRELWRTDGTRAGTRLVEDITPSGRQDNWGPQGLLAAGGTLYFTSGDGNSALWKSDGTAAGTLRVFEPGVDGLPLYASPAMPAGEGIVFYGHSTDDDAALWRTDGTSTGTTQIYDFVADDCVADCREIDGLERVGGRMFLRLTLHTHIPDGSSTYVSGSELWTSDGTTEGTKFIETFSHLESNGSGGPPFGAFTTFKGSTYFIAEAGPIRQLLRLADGPGTVPTCFGIPASITGTGTLTGTNGQDVIVGSNADDTIDGLGRGDLICGGAGNDVFQQGGAADGADMHVGGPGIDTVDYSGRSTKIGIELDATYDSGLGAVEDWSIEMETAIGGSGPDVLVGTDQDDVLVGGGGADRFYGFAGDDIMRGGAGDDLFDFDYLGYTQGADVVDGQTGTDTIDYGDMPWAVHATLDAIDGDDGHGDEGDTFLGIDVLIGGYGDDVLIGGDADDRIIGSYGDDWIEGRGGDDILDLLDGTGGDSGDGGNGTDTARADSGDTVLNVP